MPLVLVRTPTYRRPDLLRRAIACLQAQSHSDWMCEVRDDCPDASAREVVEDLADPRIIHVHNRPQKFMVANLDGCFHKENPYGADYFYMLEDDNQIRPRFLERGIDILTQENISICQINQVIEHDSRTDRARIGTEGIFDNLFEERLYQPGEIHLAALVATGISNGAVFWSRGIRNELAIRVATIPTLEEYLRAALVAEPIFICHDKLAVWAQNEQCTNRNMGIAGGWLRRELDLKASITALQRHIWNRTAPHHKDAWLAGGVIRTPMATRLEAMRKAGIRVPEMPRGPGIKARLKRLAVRQVGRVHDSVGAVVARAA